MKNWLSSVSSHRGARRQVVRLLVASLVVGAAALPASASAAVTLGATGGSGGLDCPPDFTWAQNSTAAGSPSYVVPAGGGVITSWSHDRGPALATAQLRLKVFRRTAAPGVYLTVGESGFEPLAAAGVNTFATRIPVQGGDLVGFRIATAPVSCRRTGSTGDAAVASGPGQPDPAIGSSVTFGSTGAFLLNLAARLETDCDADGLGDDTQDPDTKACKDRNFSFGKVKRNRRRGTATLSVEVPGPGTLQLAGKGLAAQGAVSAASQVKLQVKAKGKKRRKLNRSGAVKVNAEVTYTPAGGLPNTQPRRIKLVKRR
jgi:hypothetical protein